MSDDRNRLFEEYNKILEELQPDGFVFENVPGILNMRGGQVFGMILKELGAQGYGPEVWRLRAEEYGVPQRRMRVFIIGLKPDISLVGPPPGVTSSETMPCLLESQGRCVSVRDALEDLPALKPGEDGSRLEYSRPPSNAYQSFMRGKTGAAEFLRQVAAGAVYDRC